MARSRIVTFSGSARRPSRSRSLAVAIAAATAGHIEADIETFDILDAGQNLVAYTRNELGAEARRIIEAIEEADALIAVTPVYKGSYAGLFKHLIDFVEPQALLNKPVVIGATGGGHRHALIVEHQLRPLFGFFSALIVPTSIYASDHEFADYALVDRGVLDRVELAGAQLAGLLSTRQPAHRPSGNVERLPTREPRLKAAAL